MDDRTAIENAVDQWFQALNGMLNGDPAPFAELYSHEDDVVYMSAQGGYCIGWEATYADWTQQAENAIGGDAKCADLHIILGGDMAVAHHRTRGTVIKPGGETTAVSLRETSVFHKEAGQWKIVSHHADDFTR